MIALTFSNICTPITPAPLPFHTHQYLLTSGKDSIVKLWEVGSSRCLIAYTGAGSTGKQQYKAHACFNHTEDYGYYRILARVEHGFNTGVEHGFISRITSFGINIFEKKKMLIIMLEIK